MSGLSVVEHLTDVWRRRHPRDFASPLQLEQLRDQLRIQQEERNRQAIERVHAAALRSNAQVA